MNSRIFCFGYAMFGYAMFGFALLVLAAPFERAFAADNASSERLKSLVGMIDMEKLTVGPYDNYQPTIHTNESTMFFVRKTGLTNQIYSQKLPHVDPVAFVSSSADSQQPALSPNGSTLAYVSFEMRSLGSICTTSTSEFKPTCIDSNAGAADGQVSAPFWITNDQLAYLVKDMKTEASKVVVQNLSSKDPGRELLSGQIWAPSVSLDGQYLVYMISKDEGHRDLVVRDMKSGKESRLKTNMPGNPGFAAFSVRRDFLYFSYYFSDTSGDQRIDGNDNSVIFRVNLQDVLDGKETSPEQLTSLTNNCNFPRPANQFLYVSCAFDGALDIYRLPLNGVLPALWTKEQMLDSYKTARTYGDRLLLLHNMQRRFHVFSNREYLERNMGNHLLAEDYSAASYYAQSLFDLTKDDLYLATRIFADAWSQMGNASDRLPSASLRESLNQSLKQSNEVKNSAWARDVVRIRIRAFLDQRIEALRDAKNLKWPDRERPLARYLYFHTLRDLLRLPGQKPLESKSLYLHLMNAPELTEESRLYYAFEWLGELQRVVTDIPARRAEVQSLLASSVDPSVKLLLQVETMGLDIIPADAKARVEIYGKMTKLASDNQKNYFLSRAMYVRNVLTLTQANEFQYLNFVANNWIRFTSKESSEYLQAIRQLKTTILGRAYDEYAKKKYSVSASLFYGSLSVIDDLESHFGFIQTKLIEGQRARLDEQYAFLVKSGFAVESMKYVQALLEVVDFSPEQDGAEKKLDRAIAKLESMDDYVNDPARRLLLGYCYLEKSFLNSKGLEIDRDSFEKAHFHLMLVTDVGHDNDRMLSSAYQNLAVLHQRALNHGLAIEFLLKQKSKIGFLTSRDEVDWAYSISRSYFYLGQYGDAYRALKQVQSMIPEDEKPFANERMAFYAFAKEDYPSAVKHYEDLGKSKAGAAQTNSPFNSPFNSPQVQLAYAVSLFHTNQTAAATERFLKVVDLTQNAPATKSDGPFANIPKVKERMKLIALGYLSNSSKTKEAQTTYLMKYDEALDQAMKDFQDLGLRKDSVVKYKMITGLRRLEVTTDPAKRTEMIENVASQLKEYVSETGQYLGATISESLTSLVGEMLLQSDVPSAKSLELLTDIYQKYIRAVDGQPYSVPLAKQRLKLDAYWAAYHKSDMKLVRTHPWYKTLATSAPPVSVDLEHLFRALELM